MVKEWRLRTVHVGRSWTVRFATLSGYNVRRLRHYFDFGLGFNLKFYPLGSHNENVHPHKQDGVTGVLYTPFYDTVSTFCISLLFWSLELCCLRTVEGEPVFVPMPNEE